MNIRITNKLAKLLKIKVTEKEKDTTSINEWTGSFFEYGDELVLMFINDKLGLSVALFNYKKESINDINKSFYECLEDSLRLNGIPSSIINMFLNNKEPLNFYKASSREMFGRYNQKINDFFAYQESIHLNSFKQPNVSKNMDQCLLKLSKNEYETPINLFVEHFKKENEELMKFEVFEITIKLNMDDYFVTRTVLVPSYLSLLDLHNIIQRSYLWQNYHLSDFKGTNKAGKVIRFVPIVNEYTLESRFETRPAESILIKEYFKHYSNYLYTYDYGDSWEHTFELGKVHTYNSPPKYIECIKGENNAPPEDAGGPGGFMYFLEVTSNKNHKEYNFMKEWGENQKYREFSLKAVNYRLRIL